MADKQSKIPDAARHFSDLDDEARVRVRVVAILLACSRATIHRMTLDGRLPAPSRLSPGCTTWRVGDIRRVLTGGVLK